MITTIYSDSDLSITYDTSLGRFAINVRVRGGWATAHRSMPEMYEIAEKVLRVREAGAEEVNRDQA